MISSLPSAGFTATINPLNGVDHELASWFHAHLTHGFVAVMRIFSDFGNAESIGIALACLAIFLVLKRSWLSLVIMIVAVPGGMLLNEWIKILVHRHRPFVDGWFVDWSGYSFASGHTIGATLLYGQIVAFILPAIRRRHWRVLIVGVAAMFIVIVGFSRIALGAHYLSDVLAAICMGALWLMFCLFLGRHFVVSRGTLPSNFMEPAPLPPLDVATASEVILPPNE